MGDDLLFKKFLDEFHLEINPEDSPEKILDFLEAVKSDEDYFPLLKQSSFKNMLFILDAYLLDAERKENIAALQAKAAQIT